jgi:hypothetical protein
MKSDIQPSEWMQSCYKSFLHSQKCFNSLCSSIPITHVLIPYSFFFIHCYIEEYGIQLVFLQCVTYCIYYLTAKDHLLNVPASM